MFVSANPVSIGVRDQEGNLPSGILRNAAFIFRSSGFSKYLRYQYKFLLHNAIEKGLSKQVVKLLLVTFPVRCWTKYDGGIIPLHFACSSALPNHLDYVMLLLEFHAASVIIEDNDGRTQLQYLSAERFMELKSDCLLLYRH